MKTPLLLERRKMEICCYVMKILGAEEPVKEFVRMLRAEGEYHQDGLGLIDSANLRESQYIPPAIYSCTIEGECASSVAISMMEPRRKSLESESKRLNLVLEIYSTNSDEGLQEHFIFVQGNVWLSEEKEFIEGYGEFADYLRIFLIERDEIGR